MTNRQIQYWVIPPTADIEMARLLEGRYANCPRVILICDQLNTHTKGAFYEAFEPERR
ncbi:hypothetical protein [Chamaesiphon minutus]|uniref:hypothetical protein n=1 Tax=Chamaesiphon minutus TaxID=1173032 RepID=UPI0003013A9D|nr:hypothetical protein [Chamaesiphon minutus]